MRAEKATPGGDDGVVLRLRDVSLGYGARPVLSGIDWVVRRGEVWFLLGPNGSGKTTLLRAVLGSLAPYRGVVARHAIHGARERLGYVPQRPRLDPTLPTTVREFVSLGFVGTSIPRSERSARLARVLAEVGLAGRERAALRSLSGGQRQRVLVARALVRQPRLMILDEPTAGMDVASQDAFLRTLIQRNRDEGLTLLFVTHDLGLAARHASHVALFHEGHVHAGPREAILASAAVERVFGVRVALDGAGDSPRVHAAREEGAP